MIGVREEDAALEVPQFAVKRAELHGEGTALADVTSRRKYGFPHAGEPTATTAAS